MSEANWAIGLHTGGPLGPGSSAVYGLRSSAERPPEYITSEDLLVNADAAPPPPGLRWQLSGYNAERRTAGYEPLLSVPSPKEQYREQVIDEEFNGS